MNTAISSYTMMNSLRAVVDMTYTFTDGRKNHKGFSMVDVDLPSKLYDACYNRAEALAKEQSCRLERFSKAEFRVHVTNFQYYVDGLFDTMDCAVEAAQSTGFDTTIHKSGELVGSWSPISGFKLFRG